MTRRRGAFIVLYFFLAMSVILEVWRWVDPGGGGWIRTAGIVVSLVGLFAFILLSGLGTEST